MLRGYTFINLFYISDNCNYQFYRSREKKSFKIKIQPEWIFYQRSSDNRTTENNDVQLFSMHRNYKLFNKFLAESWISMTAEFLRHIKLFYFFELQSFQCSCVSSFIKVRVHFIGCFPSAISDIWVLWF